MTRDELEEYKRICKHHLTAASGYAEKSHETTGVVSDGYSALSEAHEAFALTCGDLAGVDLSAYKGEM
jgi:hypothetical protein